MTVIQKQCLLCYLGYYAGKIDGIWGPQSQAAMEKFCSAYGVKECWEDALRKAVAEDNWWQHIRYFTPDEFACKCGKHCNGYPSAMHRQPVELADSARTYFRQPGIVISGLRCQTHNASVGGVSNSRHMQGKAVDLQIRGISARELLNYIVKQPGVRYAYAINDTNVHFDVD